MARELNPEQQQQISLLQSWVDVADRIFKGVANRAATSPPPPREFKLKEISELTGISTSTLYHARRDGEIKLSISDSKGTLQDIVDIKRHFYTMGANIPDPDEHLAYILSFINFKGGCWKTSSSQHAASYWANKGKSVLFIDNDAQASGTLAFGLKPDIDTNYDNTLASLLDGSTEFDSVEETVDYVREMLIRPTYLPTLDILPACLELSAVEFDMIRDIAVGDKAFAEVLLRMKNIVDGLREYYDIIILDGTPALGMMSLNLVFAADTLIVPVPTERNDFASTQTFTKMYIEYCKKILAGIGYDFPLPEMLVLPTRYSTSSSAESETIYQMMKKVYGPALLPVPIRKHEAAISNLSLVCRTVFDVKAGYNKITAKQRNAAMENFGEAFDHIYARTIAPHEAEVRAAREAEKETN